MFVASYEGRSQVSEYTVPAEVHPCTDPFSLRFFLDAGLSQQVPVSEEDPDKCVLQHTAGEAVRVQTRCCASVLCIIVSLCWSANGLWRVVKAVKISVVTH